MFRKIWTAQIIQLSTTSFCLGDIVKVLFILYLCAVAINILRHL